MRDAVLGEIRQLGKLGDAKGAEMVMPLELQKLGLKELQECGVHDGEAPKLLEQLSQILASAGPAGPATLWHTISQSLLKPAFPHLLHRLLFDCVYLGWDEEQRGPPPAWTPSLELAEATNVGLLLKLKGKELLGPQYKDPINSFSQLQLFSVKQPAVYWNLVLEALDICFTQKACCIVDTSMPEYPGGRWLPGAFLNAAACCLRSNKRKTGLDVAVVWRVEGEDECLQSFSLDELREKVCQVANALKMMGFARGDPIAIDMPMTVYAVIVYLAIVLAGCVVVSIADSFAPSEIASRLHISKAKGIFTQDYIVRDGKVLPLYVRVVEANAPVAIVITETNHCLSVCLREGDIHWKNFLALTDGHLRASGFEPVVQPVEAFSNILFSSGTTGDPKAIPWTHATPIKAAADAWAHHDLRHGDVVCWPTNLGWMMGPWLIYAALLNGATIALYNGAPLGRGFAKFVQDAKVTMLGVVPSIVKAWKNTNCTAGLDWSAIRCFSSTGEASNADDYLWLMGRALFKPVIEYCGGTEIGGAFATGSMLQYQSLSAFSTAAMGCSIILLDEHASPLPPKKPGVGECALDPMILGASTTLLNADHFKVYFKDMPIYKDKILRRHGDEFERMANGYFRALGRVDDTMNLGGIKVSSVEIERVCNNCHESVLETAAISVPPTGGGPEQLLIVTVLKYADDPTSADALKQAFNRAIQATINPLFKVSLVVLVPSLPRTASNKIMRRTLRSDMSSRHEVLLHRVVSKL